MRLSLLARRRLGRLARFMTLVSVVTASTLLDVGRGSGGAFAAFGPAVSPRSQAPLERSRDPRPLRGAPLASRSELHLVVADDPPFLLDVDSGTATPIAGIPSLVAGGGVLWVVGVAGRSAFIVVLRTHDSAVYATHGPLAETTTYLGPGTQVAPGENPRALWIRSSVDGSNCSLRGVGLDGSTVSPSRPFPCDWNIDATSGGSLGLVVRRTRVINPRTGATVFKSRLGILAIAGKRIVLRGPGRQFTLVNAATDSERRLPWPSVLGWLDRPAVDPRGRYIALTFADPAWGCSSPAGIRRLASRHEKRNPETAAGHACARRSQAYKCRLDTRRAARPPRTG